MALLQRERELRDIAALVGPEALEDRDRLTLAVASVVREVILRQNAYHPVDCASTLKRTHALAAAARELLRAGEAALAAGTPMAKLEIGRAERALAALRDAPDAEFEAAAGRGARRRAEAHVSGVARTYRGAHAAAGPLLFLQGARRGALGEWVTITAPGQPDRRGQVLEVSRDGHRGAGARRHRRPRAAARSS